MIKINKIYKIFNWFAFDFLQSYEFGNQNQLFLLIVVKINQNNAQSRTFNQFVCTKSHICRWWQLIK